MALPTTRAAFMAYIKRRLGAPVLKANMADEQIDDCIDYAVQYWQDYHHEGTERVYLVHQMTADDKINKYVEVDDTITSIQGMWALSSMLGSSSNLFSLSYQFAQSDFLSSALSGSLVPYWMAMTHVELVQQVLVGAQPIRYNRHTDKVYLDMDMTRVGTGEYIILDGYQKIDPDEYPQVWSDRWLLTYATALAKRDMGTNLKKYGSMSMAGGVTFNGQKIYDEAEEERIRLEEAVINDYGGPIDIFFG